MLIAIQISYADSLTTQRAVTPRLLPSWLFLLSGRMNAYELTAWLSTVPIGGELLYPAKTPPLPERYVHFFGFSLADMPPVAFLTTFCVEEETDHSRGYRARQPPSVYNAGRPLRRDWRPLWASVSSRGRVEHGT